MPGPIKAISSGLPRVLPPLDAAATPAPVRHAQQPALHVDARLGGLAQRRSPSQVVGRRNAVLPAVPLHRPVAQVVIHARVQPQPHHSLGSHVWSQWAARNQALGKPWTGALHRCTNRDLEARRVALRGAVRNQLTAIKANNAVPGARIIGQDVMVQDLKQRLAEARQIQNMLDLRKKAPVAQGAPGLNRAQVARLPPAPRPLHQMSKVQLRQRRDVLQLAVKDHDLSTRMFEKIHGHREPGIEDQDQRVADYRAEIGRIDRLQARHAPRK